jgi:hypothetical protein
MAKEITAERCYSIYHDAKMFAQKGIHPKAIKNWEPIKGRPTWPYFEKLADMLHRSAGRIDPKEYITTVVNFYPKSITPKMLTTPKGVKAYKSQLKSDKMEASDEYKIGQLKNSILFVVKYMLDNDLKDFRDYFHDKASIYPTLIHHMDSGKISRFFVHLIPNLKDRIESYPGDIRADFFNDKFWDENSIFIVVANNNSDMKKIKSNLEEIINELVQKNKKRNKEDE